MLFNPIADGRCQFAGSSLPYCACNDGKYMNDPLCNERKKICEEIKVVASHDLTIINDLKNNYDFMDYCYDL